MNQPAGMENRVTLNCYYWHEKHGDSLFSLFFSHSDSLYSELHDYLVYYMVISEETN